MTLVLTFARENGKEKKQDSHVFEPHPTLLHAISLIICDTFPSIAL